MCSAILYIPSRNDTHGLSYPKNTEDVDFKEACLQAHNNIRELHGVDSLEFDEDLANSAAEWAKYNLENCK